MNLYNLFEIYVASGEITSSGIYMLRSALKRLYEAYGLKDEKEIPEVSYSRLLDHLEDYLKKQNKTSKVIRENKYWIRRLLKFSLKADLIQMQDDEIKTGAEAPLKSASFSGKPEDKNGSVDNLKNEGDLSDLSDKAVDNIKIFKTPWLIKFILILIGIVVLGMVLLADMIHRQFESYVFDQFQQHQLVIAKSVANGLGGFIMEMEKEINVLSQSQAIQLMDSQCQAELNKAYQINKKYINSLKLIDSSGNIRFRVRGRDPEIVKNISENLEQYFPLFQRQPDRVHTALVVHLSSPKKVLLLMLVPIIHSGIKDLPKIVDGQSRPGFMIVEIDLIKTAQKFLQHVTSEDKKYGLRYGLLINQAGLILYHSDYKRIGEEFLAADPSNPKLSQYRQGFLREIREGREGSIKENFIENLKTLSNNKLKLFAYSPLKVHEQIWSVVVAAPYQEIHPINRVHSNIAMLMIGLFCLVSFGSFIIFKVNKKRIKVEEEIKYLEKKLEMEDQIRKSEERLRAILESIGSDRISIMDKDLNIIWANSVAFQSYGKNIIGQKCYQIYKGSYTPCDSCLVQKTFRDGKIYSSEELALVDKDGTSILYLTSSSPIRDRNGKIVSVVETSKDITERMRMQEEIKSSRDLLDAILSNMNDGLWVIDTKYNILFMNQNLINLFGNQIHKKCYRVFMGEETPCHPCALDKIFKEDHQSVNFIKENKQKQLIEISASVLSMEEGSRSIIEVVRDITERKRLEVQLVESEQRRIKELKERYRFGNIIGKNPKMQEIYELIHVVAQNMTTVLLLGESGTGKELIARAIHYNSPQHDKPFVEVCCSVLSENLLESELFGHVKGAFTGAVRDKIGRFEMADGGTIFLDEVGDISLSVQVKLLRVIQEREFVPVGGEKVKSVNVRIIAATNKDMKKAVENKEFREDLYYRLKVVPINIPPLRERMEDLPILVNHFIEKFREKTKKPIRSVNSQAMDRLFAYSWPGNVRELENAIEHAFVKCEGVTIGPENLPTEIYQSKKVNNSTNSLKFVDQKDLSDLKKDILLKTLKETGWNPNESAKILKISRATFYRWLKKYNINRNSVS